jgi:hypothetical protein
MENQKKLSAINHTYNSVISEAIHSSENKMMRVSEIYDYLYAKYTLYLNKNWKHSVRHSLSLKKLFMRVKYKNKNGYWTFLEEKQELQSKKKKASFISNIKRIKLKYEKKLDDEEILSFKKKFLRSYLQDINFI